MKYFSIFLLFFVSCSSSKTAPDKNLINRILYGAINKNNDVLDGSILIEYKGNTIHFNQFESKQLIQAFYIDKSIGSLTGKSRSHFCRMKLTDTIGDYIWINIYRIGNDVLWVSDEDNVTQVFIDVEFIYLLEKIITQKL